MGVVCGCVDVWVCGCVGGLFILSVVATYAPRATWGGPVPVPGENVIQMLTVMLAGRKTSVPVPCTIILHIIPHIISHLPETQLCTAVIDLTITHLNQLEQHFHDSEIYYCGTFP